MVFKMMKERWYYYLFILIFIAIILFSVLKSHNYLLATAEENLDKEMELFASKLSSEYSSFESEMTYNSSIGTFSFILENQLLESNIKEKIRRIYSMNIEMIDKITIYNENLMREFTIEDLNYFEVSSLEKNTKLVLKKDKTYISLDDKNVLIIPVYDIDGNIESNVAIDLNLDSFFRLEFKNFYLGESSWGWYYNEKTGLRLLSKHVDVQNEDIALSDMDYIKLKLQDGYKGKLINKLTNQKVNVVVTSFYPVKFGIENYAIGFSVAKSVIDGEINRLITIIVFSFISMIVLILIVFSKLIKEEVKVKFELNKSNETLDRILKEIPTTIIIHRRNLDIVYMNEFGKRQFKLDGDFYANGLNLNNNFEDFTLENHKNIKLCLSVKDEKISVLKNTVPIEYYGEELFLTAIIDVSPIEKARKMAEDSNRMKSEFIANVSHEIRTPMNGIIASTEILGGMDNTIEQNEYIGIIEKSANHLMIIINDILDLSKIESGKLIIEKTQFDIRETIKSVNYQFIAKAIQKKIEIVSNISNDIPDKLIGDPNRLKQVLSNLIGNAVKFTNEGFVYIRVDLEKNSKNEAKLFFTIADTGIGISKEAIPTIFEPFTQADGSITRKFGGTGLGTTISKKIINEMGGSISVNSPNELFDIDGKGTVFTFDLTFKIGEDKYEISQDSESSNLEIENRLVKGTVLVAEDNMINMKIILKYLSRFDLNIISVSNGQEVIDKLQSIDVDLIFMDLQMPVLNGIETAKIIRNKDKKIVIIAMTANAMDLHKKAVFESGMNGFLSKPLKFNDIKTTLINNLKTTSSK